MNKAKATLGLAVSAMTLGLTFGLTGTAAATEGSGNCSTSDEGAGGDLCVYYNSNYAGARFNSPYFMNYAGWTFKSWSGGSAGAGQAVKNNAASVSNYDLDLKAVVYYNSNQSGPSQTIAVFGQANLNSTLKNENASQGWKVP